MGLGWGLIICKSGEFTGDVTAVALATVLWELGGSRGKELCGHSCGPEGHIHTAVTHIPFARALSHGHRSQQGDGWEGLLGAGKCGLPGQPCPATVLLLWESRAGSIPLWSHLGKNSCNFGLNWSRKVTLETKS